MKKITPEQIINQVKRRLQADREEAKAIAEMTGARSDTYGQMLEEMAGVLDVLGLEPWRTMFDSVLASAIAERERWEQAKVEMEKAAKVKEPTVKAAV